MNIMYGNPCLMGAVKTESGYNFAIESEEGEIDLLLYKSGAKTLQNRIVLDKSYKTGNIFAVLIQNIDLKEYQYCYEEKGIYKIDPYARTISNCGRFGIVKKDALYTSRVELEPFDWEGDSPLCLPYEQCIVYKIHPRGFTRSRTSGADKKGTFHGIIEKIPYLKELGITTLELMPAYEFDEIRRFEEQPESVYMSDQPVRLNYWGYTTGLHFAPKSAYSSIAAANGDYTKEFKTMVKELHKNGIEVVMEMYFNGESTNLINDCIRYWVLEYHIDGVHLYCDENSLYAVSHDALLANTKIFTVYWEKNAQIRSFKNVANYNHDFSNVARRFLKGDEDQLSAFLQAIKRNPSGSAVINYITNHDGFTLMDLVSYDRKHNEENGENNRDGEEYNHSWNCGTEGKTGKKKIQELRIRQIKNAFMMTLIAQGTPLILAGDEFGNSQDGNNNPYCIDSEKTWLNWKKDVYANELFLYVKELICFRKMHKILHMGIELSSFDSLSCGYPDVSYHGDVAWNVLIRNYNRHIGVMYCSEYASESEKAKELIYIAYNMHWEKHELALPKTAEGCEWNIIMSTVENNQNLSITDNKILKIEPRCVVILIGKVKQSGTQKPKSKKSMKRDQK